MNIDLTLQNMLKTHRAKSGLPLGKIPVLKYLLGEVGVLAVKDFSNVCICRDHVDVSACLKILVNHRGVKTSISFLLHCL